MGDWPGMSSGGMHSKSAAFHAAAGGFDAPPAGLGVFSPGAVPAPSSSPYDSQPFATMPVATTGGGAGWGGTIATSTGPHSRNVAGGFGAQSQFPPQPAHQFHPPAPPSHGQHQQPPLERFRPDLHTAAVVREILSELEVGPEDANVPTGSAAGPVGHAELPMTMDDKIELLSMLVESTPASGPGPQSGAAQPASAAPVAAPTAAPVAAPHVPRHSPPQQPQSSAHPNAEWLEFASILAGTCGDGDLDSMGALDLLSGPGGDTVDVFGTAPASAANASGLAGSMVGSGAGFSSSPSSGHGTGSAGAATDSGPPAYYVTEPSAPIQVHALNKPLALQAAQSPRDMGPVGHARPWSGEVDKTEEDSGVGCKAVGLGVVVSGRAPTPGRGQAPYTPRRVEFLRALPSAAVPAQICLAEHQLAVTCTDGRAFVMKLPGLSMQSAEGAGSWTQLLDTTLPDGASPLFRVVSVAATDVAGQSHAQLEFNGLAVTARGGVVQFRAGSVVGVPTPVALPPAEFPIDVHAGVAGSDGGTFGAILCQSGRVFMARDGRAARVKYGSGRSMSSFTNPAGSGADAEWVAEPVDNVVKIRCGKFPNAIALDSDGVAHVWRPGVGASKGMAQTGPLPVQSDVRFVDVDADASANFFAAVDVHGSVYVRRQVAVGRGV